MHSQVK